MLKIQRVHPDAIPPKRAKKGDSGLDLYSVDDIKIPPKSCCLVPTGWKMSVPEGYEIQVRPRSGLACNNVTVRNSPGTVDCSYRGEVKVILYNGNSNTVSMGKGSKIAQMVIAEVNLWEPKEVDFLDETDRGEGGFGSTGV